MAYTPWNPSAMFQQPYNPMGSMQPQMMYPNPNQMAPQPINQIRPIPQLNGRFVNGLEEITPSEVPMDGNCAIFPQNDYKCVYVRMWNGQGELKTLKFIPEPAKEVEKIEPKESSQEILNTLQSTVLQRLDSMESNLEKLIQRKPQNCQCSSNKKGDNHNESL